MAVTFLIPTALRNFTDQAAKVHVEGQTVEEALGHLVQKHDTMKKHLFDGNAQLRHFVNLYLGDEDIRYLDGLKTTLTPGATLSIIPSIAGGIEK